MYLPATASQESPMYSLSVYVQLSAGQWVRFEVAVSAELGWVLQRGLFLRQVAQIYVGLSSGPCAASEKSRMKSSCHLCVLGKFLLQSSWDSDINPVALEAGLLPSDS